LRTYGTLIFACCFPTDILHLKAQFEPPLFLWVNLNPWERIRRIIRPPKIYDPFIQNQGNWFWRNYCHLLFKYHHLLKSPKAQMQ